MLTIDIEKAKAAKARLEQEKLNRENNLKFVLEAKEKFESDKLSKK